MKLFKYEGYNVVVDPEALLLKPFKAIWDKFKDKEEAKQYLDFIYFYCDPRSDFMIIEDQEERLDEISKQILGEKKKFKITKEVQDAIDFYIGFKPASVRLLESAKGLASKIQRKMDNLDLDSDLELDNTMNALKILKELPQVTKSIAEAEKAVNTDMQQVGGKARGSAEKKILEDGFSDF